jgi:dihydroorotate dehydrogenase (NAD+) catalytic subunit
VKAKKRVVTSAAVRGTGPKRTPTVRRVRSAIVPVARPATAPARPTAPARHALAAPAEKWTDDDYGADTGIDLSVDLGRGLVLTNPLVAASGPFGYGVEMVELVDLARLGAIVTRGTTLRARSGGRAPRMAEVPAGLLNAVGLQNPGVDAIVERYAPAWQGWSTPVVVNVAGESVGDVVEVVRRLDGVPGVAGVELNLACPNASRGGLAFALDPEAAGSLTAAVRRATDMPVVAKLSPSAADVRAVARALADAGADAISAVNTLPGLALARGRRGPLFPGAYGGLSGPALRPIALRVVYEVVAAVDLPVVAMGGVATLDDVLDFLAVGAVAVGVGTAALADPGLPGRLAAELAARCRAERLASHRSLVGTARPRRGAPTSARGAEYRA